jgi:prepilin-type N-terminal cleavage/methylation domain-containing protein
MNGLKVKISKGFTLVELLVVIAIIGLLSTLAIVSLNNARQKARDSKRLSDMKQILLALELYYDANNRYPGNTDNDCGGWDTGFNGGQSSGDPFIQPLKDSGFIDAPGDPITTGNCQGYRYYRYGAGSSGCDSSRGAFFVLGVVNMETSGRPHPDSPGWSCPSRNWQNEMDWVTGRFER